MFSINKGKNLTHRSRHWKLQDLQHIFAHEHNSKRREMNNGGFEQTQVNSIQSNWVLAGDINHYWEFLSTWNTNEHSAFETLLETPQVCCHNDGGITRPE